MTKPSLLQAGWTQLKEFWLAIVAAALMYAGIHQIISALNYPITDLTVRFINAVLMKAFRDRRPLADYYTGFPWSFHVKVACEGIFVLIVGALLGLWVNAASQRQSAS